MMDIYHTCTMQYTKHADVFLACVACVCCMCVLHVCVACVCCMCVSDCTLKRYVVVIPFTIIITFVGMILVLNSHDFCSLQDCPY